MPLNKFLLIGSGAALAGTGTGLGVYYGINGSSEEVVKSVEKEKSKPEVKTKDREDTRKEDLSRREHEDSGEDLEEPASPSQPLPETLQ